MQVRQVMTQNPTCCTPDTRLQEVANMMVVHHCGAIPVVGNLETRHPIGIITDRDIACRSLAEGKNPLQMTAQECMSTPVVTVRPDNSIEECCRLMEQNRIRRIPVVNAKGGCEGIVAQADIARKGPDFETVDILKAISRPTEAASFVAV
ncbi:MAG TPA: CBS domain-containing protein [Chthonomonadaceae bacterium]|nr:CBS domain-containing protein [Chthonomonadaceae bacterium]